MTSKWGYLKDENMYKYLDVYCIPYHHSDNMRTNMISCHSQRAQQFLIVNGTEMRWSWFKVDVLYFTDDEEESPKKKKKKDKKRKSEGMDTTQEAEGEVPR